MKTGYPALLAALALFAAFFANVALGAFARAAFLDDVGEMLLLFAATLMFVVGILQRERAVRDAAGGQKQSGPA